MVDDERAAQGVRLGRRLLHGLGRRRVGALADRERPPLRTAHAPVDPLLHSQRVGVAPKGGQLHGRDHHGVQPGAIERPAHVLVGRGGVVVGDGDEIQVRLLDVAHDVVHRPLGVRVVGVDVQITL
jgi:hypothetical protein